MSRSNEEDQRAVSSACPNNTRSGASEPSVIVPSEGAAPTLDDLVRSGEYIITRARLHRDHSEHPLAERVFSVNLRRADEWGKTGVGRAVDLAEAIEQALRGLGFDRGQR